VTHPIATIARYTLLEAVRTRLPQLLAAVIVLLVATSLFVHEIAVTESTRMQVGIYASSARLASVFIAGLYVLASVTREFNDKGLDIALALELPRSHYILGKLAGFIAVGIGLAAAVSLPLAVVAPFDAALKWGASLVLELGIVIALSLFCTVTFRHMIAAASFVMAFYLLARTLTAIRLLSAHPLTGADSAVHRGLGLLAEGLAFVVPTLDRWTQTGWLVNQQANWLDIGGLLVQSVIYIAFLTAAATFDFYRKSF
jgi:ABC-type transport system involved in multi-copper enzyme maturation permease subunit